MSAFIFYAILLARVTRISTEEIEVNPPDQLEGLEPLRLRFRRVANRKQATTNWD